MLHVFYDNKCGLCRREINFYKRFTPLHPITWVDIHHDEETLKRFNLSREEAMGVFHVIDANQTKHTGIDAFCVLWQALPYWRSFAKIVQVPFVKKFADFLYGKYTKKRSCPASQT